jgi:hypothetical protein
MLYNSASMPVWCVCLVNTKDTAYTCICCGMDYDISVMYVTWHGMACFINNLNNTTIGYMTDCCCCKVLSCTCYYKCVIN